MEVQTGSPAPAAGGAPPAASSSEPTPAAAASTPPAVTVNGNGTPGTKASEPPAGATAGKWTDTFDAETKDWISQRNFKDPKELADSYRNLEKLRGVPADRLLKLPDQKDENYDKAMGEVFEKLGKPATPEGYGFQAKDPNNAGFTNWAKDAFHKLNLTTAQGQELVKQFNEYQDQVTAQEREEYAGKVQAQTMNLKKEWGAAYEQNVMQARMAYKQLGIPDAAIDSLEKSIGFDGVMKLMHTLGTRVMEHGFISGNNTGFGEGTIYTPEQANARIKALKQDSEWSARYLKGGAKEKAEMERLMKMANPTD